jgi:hypothetical protein
MLVRGGADLLLGDAAVASHHVVQGDGLLVTFPRVETSVARVTRAAAEAVRPTLVEIVGGAGHGSVGVGNWSLSAVVCGGRNGCRGLVDCVGAMVAGALTGGFSLPLGVGVSEMDGKKRKSLFWVVLLSPLGTGIGEKTG